MLSGCNVLLGITGGIACYKSCEIVSRLRKNNANVDVIMTSHAQEFVTKLTLETLSNNPVTTDMFNRTAQWEVGHISLAKKADICVIAPATANIIAKLAHGIADDMLTTTALALKCPILIAPAMNTNMYENVATQANIQILKQRGFLFIDSIEGKLACGDVGKGKMAEPMDIVNAIIDIVRPSADYSGKTVLITAGATQENIDGVRFITNRSSGKMGVEIAKAVANRGGKVIFVQGITSVDIPNNFYKIVRVKSTQEMADAVLENMAQCDIIIKAAAPSDYRPLNKYNGKIKGENITLELTKNIDIAKAVGQDKGDKKLVIFCAETNDLVQNAKLKLQSKNADMVVANDVTQKGAGFDTDTNIATIIMRSGKVVDCPLMLKSTLANIILDNVLEL